MCLRCWTCVSRLVTASLEPFKFNPKLEFVKLSKYDDDYNLKFVSELKD